MLRCYVLDDEQHAVDALCTMLVKKFSATVKVCGSTTQAAVALKEIEDCRPDLLFLDVEMPLMSGFEVLKHFPVRTFSVIFTTAHERYALPALKAAAVDYLVKPLSPQDVYEALERCAAAKKTAANMSPLQWITLHTQGETVVTQPADIIRIEAVNNYSVFYFTNRSQLTVSRTLKEYEDLLQPLPFFRIHQSHLINLSHVLSVHSTDGDYVMLTKDHRVEISRRRKPLFLERLRQKA